MPSQRWTRKVMRRAQRVARVKREKRGAARGAGERPAPAGVLEAEAVSDMERDRRPPEAGRIGDVGDVGADAGHRAVVVGIERVLQTHADAVAMVLVKERITAEVEHRVVAVVDRSEEHTSELQSRENLVCRLLLEK